MVMTKSKVEDMAHDITNTIENGSCFYDDSELLRLFYAISRLKQACADYAVDCWEEVSE